MNRKLKMVCIGLLSTVMMMCTCACDEEDIKQGINDYVDSVGDFVGGFIDGSENFIPGDADEDPSEPQEPIEPEIPSEDEDVPLEDENALKDPANVDDLIIDKLIMKKGAKLNLSVTSKTLQFECAEDESIIFGNKYFLLAPLSSFDAVNPNNYTYMDWISVFDSAGIEYTLLTFSDMSKYKEDDVTYYVGSLQAAYENVNTMYVGVGVWKDFNGDYHYAAYPVGETYRSSARSVSYVAAAALNAHVTGEESCDSNELAILRDCVNMSVDLANGLETPSNDGSMYSVEIIPIEKTLSLYETLKLEVNIAEGVMVPIIYVSADKDVATVDALGKIRAVGAGFTNIAVYVAGAPTLISITVR